ncbi:MAG: hypothetical protein QXU79_04335 [Candidatus Micrarchaeaceae archaeon]
MHEALLRILSMMAFTESFYSYDVSSLFPYLIAVLAEKQISGYIQNAAIGPGQYGVDPSITLSKRIILLQRENAKLGSEREALSKEVESLTARIIIAESAFTNDLARISEKYNLPIERLKNALGHLQAYGYRVAQLNGSFFSLVKA